MTGNTVVSTAIANKIQNAALFTEAVKRNTFTNLLTGAAPKTVSDNKADPRKQTAKGAPIVRITDLSKEMGDEVTMDLFHHLGGMATMGDRELEGRVESLTQSQFTLKIDQGRHAVSSGGKMTKQRTKHDLVRAAKAMIGPWWAKRDDQLSLCHLAGARGSDTRDWVIPLASHEEFAEQIVNPLTPPTWDRHVFGGDATTFAGIDSSDKFSLADVDKLRLLLDEMAYPLQPIQFEGDPMAEDNPFYVLGVTPRQWYDFSVSQNAYTGGNALRQLQANASQRMSVFKHPIFLGDCAMWNGILIKKMTRSVTFNSGDVVSVATNTANAGVTNATAGTKIERALLLGAQALATAFGRSGEKENGGLYFSLLTEKRDFGNKEEHAVAWMNGKKKIRFKGTDGRINDHGVIALDTAVSI